MERRWKPVPISTSCAATLLVMLATFSPPAMAVLLFDVATDAVEVVAGVEPNVMVLTDDSGSMDWEVMTLDTGNGGRFTNTQRNGTNPDPSGSGPVKHQDVNRDGTSDCSFGGTSQTFYGYIYGVKFSSNTYAPYAHDCDIAHDEEWRFRNRDFNPLYFDPERAYEPWTGVDNTGNAFADIDITNAMANPFFPTTTERIDLTQQNSLGVNNGIGFRFYTWQDADADDLFDNGEQTEYRIGALTDGQAAQWGKTAAEVRQDFANWFSYHRSREFVAKAALGQVIGENTTARIGYATINDKSDGTINNGIRVASMNISPDSGAKKSLLDKVYATQPIGSTPLQTSLRDVGRYYECSTTSSDIFNDTSSNGPGTSACPVLAASAGGACQQNHTLLMTDGFYDGSSPGVGNTDSNGSGNFDGGAFADTYSDTLADVAMHYYERDLHSSLTNLVPPTSKDIERYPGGTLDVDDLLHQHMSTNTIGFGVNGTLTGMPPNPDTAFSWPDPSLSGAGKIDDLRHAAYNGRGQFLDASDPVELVEALRDIFKDIAVGKFATSSVAFNTQNIETNSVVFRAYFDTKTNTGNLVAQRINLDGSIDTSETGTLWKAAESLDEKISASSDSRIIITTKDDGTGAAEFDWTDLTSSQKTKLNNPQPASPTYGLPVGDERLAYLRGHDQHEGPNYDAGHFRERPPAGGKLGDIVHSSPVFVGEPQFFGRLGGAWPGEYDPLTGEADDDVYAKFRYLNRDREEVVYVGANDGMLHGFKAQTGEELFAYVPNLVFNNLSQLTKPNYNHLFYLDLPPMVNDVFMKRPGASDAEWNTVLVGGLAAGGKGYFALNVTDPADFTTADEAKANVMWEFAEANDTEVCVLLQGCGKDLGLSFSQPLIAMSNADSGTGTQKKWVAIFGNGYNASSPAGHAKLFVLFIEQGQDGWQASDFIKINTGVAVPSGLLGLGSSQNGIGGIRGIDHDGNGTVDYVYAGDLIGNLYRFDLTGSNPSTWESATPQLIFNASYDSVKQPITTRPIVIKHPSKPGYIVVATTGKYFTYEDATSTEIQSIYGIWDDLSSNTVARSQLIEQTLTNKVNEEEGYTVRTLTNHDIPWKNTGSSSQWKKGWFIDLDVPRAGQSSGVEFPGERAVRNLQLRGDLLFVNTILPQASDSCAQGPGGFELGLNPVTGGVGSKVIFDINNDGNFDASDNVNNSLGSANIVAGIRFSDIPTDAAFIGNRRVTQESNTDVRSMGTNTGVGRDTGRQSWREVSF